MKQTIGKYVFLDTLNCPLLGWLNQQGLLPPDDSPFARQQMEQGREINRLSRGLFPEGELIPDVNFTEAEKRTAAMIAGTGDITLFEAAFRHGRFAARPDILSRRKGKWYLWEVKSSTDVDDDQLQDITYTAAVLAGSGITVDRASLMTVSKEYRLGMPVRKLFEETDVTDDICGMPDDIPNQFRAVESALFGPRPKAELKFFCKKCDINGECVCKGATHHIFELPYLSKKKFDALTAKGIMTISKIDKRFELSDTQEHVRRSIQSGKPYVATNLKKVLAAVVWPAYFLDFESMSTALPLYPDAAPYATIVTQYSLHICDAPGRVREHREYLADHTRDCRRETAERLLESLAGKGSIITYSHFEKSRIKEMSALFPDLAKDMESLVTRIIDLCDIIRNHYYHPDFEGSFSIKQVLPVLIPGLDYGDLEIQEGGTASALFADMVQGKLPQKEITRIRKALLAYCERDTLAMVKLHEVLHNLSNTASHS